MKIGIYTLHYANNYGAVLQAFALQSFLISKGYDVEIIDYVSRLANKRVHYKYQWFSLKGCILNLLRIFSPAVRLKIKREDEFHNKLNLSEHYDSIKLLYENPPKCDIHIVGSDQVWNLEHDFPKYHPHFLEFVKNDRCKMSYASSFGNCNIREDYKERLSLCLKNFKHLSVREQDGRDLIKSLTGKEAQIVVDPSFLLSKEEWARECPSLPLVSERYILLYGCVKSEEWVRILKAIKDILKMKIVAVSTSIIMPYKVDEFYQSAGPREFINLFFNASFVVTGSFHGMAFSLNFKKPFVIVRQGTRMSRMDSLANHLGIKDLIITDEKDLMRLIPNMPDIDMEKSYEILSNDILQSKKWLQSSVNSIFSNLS